MSKNNSIGVFAKTLPQNIFSGFVVSLIALPLCLGLALASEAPPIAGVISAICGGMVVALFGGSSLTITGPGNGLVIVLLGAITVLGEGDPLQGYYFTLAAIIFSGVLLFLFGLFRLGALSEFFPASALQGMLAAIGIGILAKQFHVMLGITSVSGSTLAQLSAFPESVQQLSTLTAEQLLAPVIGVASFVFLFLYARIRNPLFHLIPAPMWVVVATIALSYYYELILQQPQPLDPALLIQLPSDLIQSLPSPNFSKITQLDFWGVVLSITLIASIESLLSIKAVDKLDPLKRRSNNNKDLRALGLASIVSGFLGGLNVVTVIARSSVNVNNGGTNRSANFFHAFFLVLFVLLFGPQIQRIPLPALAAILVYTGYKLATPENLLRIYRIGKEQALIFAVTLGVTLYTNLISGIGAGILATFLVHLFLTKGLGLFSRNLLKPNVLMYQEQESKTYFVSVKHFCTFLNFYRLKAKLDEIPQNEHAIVDFSLSDFVDHTVMEGLNDYRDSFSRKDGNFEIIGLDVHESVAAHPFSVRRFNPVPNLLRLGDNFTKRQDSLRELALDLGWQYNPQVDQKSNGIDRFLFFKTRQFNFSSNRLTSPKKTFSFFDLSFSEGIFITKEDLNSSFLLIDSPLPLPVFVLDRESFLTPLYQLTGIEDLNFEAFPDFSKRFFLSGEDKKAIKAFFTKEVVFFFESHPIYHVESNGKKILIKGRDRSASVSEIKALLSFAREFYLILEKQGG